MRRAGLVLPPVALALAAATLVGCGASTGSSSSGASADGRLRVVASFYPIEFAVEQLGGDHVTVTSLTKPGVEPHDLELSPKDVAAVSDAQLVVYAKGFQAAVDTAVDQEGDDHAFDVAPAADLDLAAPAEEDDHGGDPHPDANTATPGPGGADGPRDPHFWLDPERYATVAEAVARKLTEIDPTNANAYSQNAAAFTGKLHALDAQFRSGLAGCTQKDLVTSHAAFGYLSERYGFTQVAIAGLSPDAEPSAAKLADIATFVRDHQVSTIYAETLVEPAFAETVARTTGAKVATLDPIEGLTSSSAGRDYLEVMRANLAALRTGQGCP